GPRTPFGTFLSACGPVCGNATTSDAAGDYAILDLTAGSYTVSLSTPAGWVPAASQNATVLAGRQTALNWVLTRDATATGTFADDAGGSVSPAPSIAFYGANYSNSTSSTGAFSLFLHPDTYTVQLGGSQYHVTPGNPPGFTAASNQAIALGTITYQRYSSVTLHVAGDNASNLQNAPVTASQGG